MTNEDSEIILASPRFVTSVRLKLVYTGQVQPSPIVWGNSIQDGTAQDLTDQDPNLGKLWEDGQ